MKKKAEKKPERDAFIESDKHALNGTRLFPWTPERVIAAQAMGMLYPRIGKEGADQYRRTKTYPGIIKDLIICLWLCTIPDDEVTIADSAPSDAYLDAKKWAVSKKLHKMDSDEWDHAFIRFVNIVNEVEQARTTPKVEPGEETDEGNE